MSTFINGLNAWFQSVFFNAPVWAQIVVVVVGIVITIGIAIGIAWIAWRIFKWFKQKVSTWPTWLKATTTIVVSFIMVIVLLVAMGKLWIGNTGSVTLDWKVNSCGGACSAAPVTPSATPTATVAPATPLPASTAAPTATPLPTSTPAPSATPLPASTAAPTATSTTTLVVPSATMPPSVS